LASCFFESDEQEFSFHNKSKLGAVERGVEYQEKGGDESTEKNSIRDEKYRRPGDITGNEGIHKRHLVTRSIILDGREGLQTGWCLDSSSLSEVEFFSSGEMTDSLRIRLN